MAIPLIASIMAGAGKTASTMSRGARGSAEAQSDNKDIKKIADNTDKSVSSSFVKKLGVGLGVGSLLKMSKGIATTVSTFFQIIGAFVDVLVAPFLPVVFKGLGKLASFIPNVARWSQGLFEKISSMDGSVFDKIIKFFTEVYTSLKAEVFDPLWEKFKGWWDSSGKEALIKLSKEAFIIAIDPIMKKQEEYRNAWDVGALIFQKGVFQFLDNLIPGFSLFSKKIADLTKDIDDKIKYGSEGRPQHPGPTEMPGYTPFTPLPPWSPVPMDAPTPTTTPPPSDVPQNNASSPNPNLIGDTSPNTSESYSYRKYRENAWDKADEMKIWNSTTVGAIYIE
tara:strand:- start:6276 stop:7286 length:1011 start_codon:yes stop_codon:yes gene_type:complete